MDKFSSVFVSLGIVAVSLIAGYLAGDILHTLIRLVLPLPSVELSTGNLVTTGIYVLSASLVIFTALAFFRPAPLFASAERAATQVYAWGAAWGAGSLALFLLSSSVFPHQLLVGAFAIGVALFGLGYAALGKDSDVAGRSNFTGRLGAFAKALFGLLRKPLAWLAILITLAPLGAAAAYVKSQEFRDAVAEFRVRQNVSVDGDWITVPVNTKTQLLQPIMIRMEPGASNRMLVLERAGRLYRIGYPDDGTKELLVDFSAQVGEVNLENGAMGFDFDPRYTQEDGSARFVYLYFTSYTADAQTNYLARFDLAAGSAQDILASQQNLIAVGRPPSQYHNGGHVEFGPDDMLYLSLGEMDMPDKQQTIDTTLTGGVLRIDVMQQGGAISRPIARQPQNGTTQGYYIPLDNPFADNGDALGEFFAIGLRNPFRFAFDKSTGNIWAGDVGSTVWEEVNLIAAGNNYQFPFVEGREPTDVARPGTVIGKETGPVYTYRHTAYDRSIIGGLVYRGSRWPSLEGKYIFGDNYSGKFWAIPATGEQVETVETLGQADKYAQRGFTSIIQAPDDRILITVMGSSNSPNGAIVELVRKDGGAGSSIGGGGEAAAAAQVAMTEKEIHESFVTNCARCHGEQGRGDGPDAEMLTKALGAAPTNFLSADFANRPRPLIRQALVGGGAAVGMSEAMPPWAGVLEDEEIDALTDYVIGLREGSDGPAPE
uniref:PQQ-dependent sugar dehydrogenase n=1 Tax=Parerythrobacter lutipelagi TaxID=1964208 RepID=UPI0010F50D1D|nr:PQQ-dependent sugar dehydrogenase [Parerythrobacter lutipelagi]